MFQKYGSSVLAGFSAGCINGTFGAGGGMVLVPLLQKCAKLNDEDVFPCSVCIILPICLVSLVADHSGSLPWSTALPYLIGGGIGGVLAGVFGKRIPTKWLHRFLGGMILWGGFRYLC